MLKTIKISVLALVPGLVLLLIAVGAQAVPTKITFLHTNDVYDSSAAKDTAAPKLEGRIKSR